MRTKTIGAFFDSLAETYDKRTGEFSYYHNFLRDFYASIIPPQKNVLEIGCATGGLLNTLKPKLGVGIDISSRMIIRARENHPHLDFFQCELSEYQKNDAFDYVVLSNVLDYVDDLILFFTSLKKNLRYDSKIIITTVNPTWQPILKLLEVLKLKTPDPYRHFITNLDVINILSLLDYDIIEKGYRLILPLPVPLIGNLINKVFSRIPVINNFCLMQFIVAKPKRILPELSCSVVIPCFNEAENIEACVAAVPKLGAFTEIVVVNDGSLDATADIVKKLLATKKNLKLVSYQPNRGKGYALKEGFSHCTGDVIIILDADMAVMPDELPLFLTPIQEGKAEFINGTRMVYKMESKAMNFARFSGNKIFGIIVSLIVGQRNTDTLCGTKSFLRKYTPYIKMGRCKWGDYDLLFGAAKTKMKMIEMPIHYQTRKAGKSKMKLIRDGLHFLKVCYWGINEVP
ncbi:MAG TPA: glycosyltransferase [Candidatus Omnitrophota bacterium]|nr:glycosyltransferase [Candidatus Omnitrophota bacterium]